MDGIVNKYQLKDFSHLKGLNDALIISSDDEVFYKQYKSVKEWNPLLLAIGNKQAEVT